jgi:hypothetical protein
VADRFQDTMGFTVVGPDHFLGSGHGEQRRESLHPPLDGDVVVLDAAFGEQLFDIAVGQAEAQLPAHRQHDDVGREAPTRERQAGHGCRAGPAGSHGSSLPAQGAPNRCNSAGEGDVRAPTSCLGVSLDGFSAADGFIDASWVTEVYRVHRCELSQRRWVQRE